MFCVVCPEEFHRRFFISGLRADGRGFQEQRSMSNVANTSNILSSDCKSYCIKKGNSVVYITLNPQVTTPTSQGVGFFGVKVEFSSSLDNYSKDKNIRYSQLLQSLIYPILNHLLLSIGNGIDAVWALYLEVLVLVDDGSIFDLILESSISVLQNYFIPVVTVDKLEDDTVLVKKTDSISTVPLISPESNLTSASMITIINKVKNEESININDVHSENISLIDPTLSEESLPNKSEMNLTCINDQNDLSKRILGFTKISGPPIPWLLVSNFIDITCNK